MDEKKDRILIADDISSMRMLLVSMLKALGYSNIEQAFDGDDAIAKYHRHKPQIILLDISMPGKDGMEVLREIKKDNKNAFVAMQTGSATSEHVKAAIELGVQDFIAKPYNLNQIRTLLERYETTIWVDSDTEIGEK